MTSYIDDAAVNPFCTDEHFDRLYPVRIKQLSSKHWTPVPIASHAAAFLAEQSGSKILDIGAGVGKFCLVGAQLYKDSHFFGVEQRRDLVRIATATQRKTMIENVTFLKGDFTRLDLNQFDHFYFYNSFYENLVDSEYHIDERIEYSVGLYEYYTQYLHRVLKERSAGTKLVTFHSFREVVPPNFRLVEHYAHPLLRCWISE